MPTGHDLRGDLYDGDATPAIWKRIPQPTKLAPWVTQAEVDYVVDEYERNGWEGGLHWYKTMDPDWEATPQLTGDGRKLKVPAGFLAGTEDLVVDMFGGVEKITADLKATCAANDPPITFLDGGGHWIQQERPGEVNEKLLEFLAEYNYEGLLPRRVELLLDDARRRRELAARLPRFDDEADLGVAPLLGAEELAVDGFEVPRAVQADAQEVRRRRRVQRLALVARQKVGVELLEVPGAGERRLGAVLEAHALLLPARLLDVLRHVDLFVVLLDGELDALVVVGHRARGAGATSAEAQSRARVAGCLPLGQPHIVLALRRQR